MEKFWYLGSMLVSDANIYNDISSRLVKARLSRCLWDNHRIRLDTKVAVYKAVILTALLYGSETRVVYRQHVRKPEQLHMRCLRRLAHVRWQEKKSNTKFLQICNITGIEAFLIMAQLRWTGHVLHMGDNRLPKAIFCSELEEGTVLAVDSESDTRTC